MIQHVYDEIDMVICGKNELLCLFPFETFAKFRFKCLLKVATQPPPLHRSFSLNYKETTFHLLHKLTSCSAKSELKNMLCSVCFRIHDNQYFSLLEVCCRMIDEVEYCKVFTRMLIFVIFCFLDKPCKSFNTIFSMHPPPTVS